MTIPNMIHRCDLDGHRWVPCTGGKECDVCGTIYVRRDIVLPGRMRFWTWDQSFRWSLIFLFFTIVFALFVYFRYYH